MDYLDRLHLNLTTGDSYLTSESRNPQQDGENTYNNIIAVAAMLYGDDPTDEQYEHVIDAFSGGSVTGKYWTRKFSARKAALEIDARAKRNGGKGWFNTEAQTLGSKTSARKAETSAANGRKGGRPRHITHAEYARRMFPNADPEGELDLAVIAESEHGDPDSSIRDWLSAGEYTTRTTIKQIAREWDSDR